MSSPREARSPRAANKTRKPRKEHVAQQRAPQQQGLEAALPATGRRSMAGVSQESKEAHGEPTSNMTALNASGNEAETFADTSVRLPASCKVWPPSIAQFKELLQTIRASIDASHPSDPSGTGVLARREDLTNLKNYTQLLEESVIPFERFVIDLLGPAAHAGRHAPSGNMDSLQRALLDPVDQWSHYSRGSDGLDDPIETSKVVDEANHIRTLENLIETCADVAMQLDDCDNYNGARQIRDDVIPMLRELLLRAQHGSQVQSPSGRFTGLNMQALAALPES